jgi:DNA-binding CsgD family transcriptional regulator
MERQRFKKLKDILEVISATKHALDNNGLKHNLLTAISKCFHIDQSLFIVQDPQGGPADFILRNLDGNKYSEYIDYFYKQDPFRPISKTKELCQLQAGSFPNKNVVSLKDVVLHPPFLSTEYYNEFYRPQKIYWEVNVFLKNRDNILGYIALFRPPRTRDFSEQDIEFLGIISPYVTLALENVFLSAKAEVRGLALETIEKSSETGLLICDDSLNILYINAKAKEFCNEMNEMWFANRSVATSIPNTLKNDFKALREVSKRSAFDLPLPPVKRVFDSPSGNYIVYTQYAEKDFSCGPKRVFMVKITQAGRQAIWQQTKTGQVFRLTKRETEIAGQIFKGFKNAEIAKRLFISEITVKKHIQNICRKIGVNNRTAIAYEIFKSDPPSVLGPKHIE